jgi:hypothetical protein
MVALHEVDECLSDVGVVATHIEHPIARQQIKISMALEVPKVGAFSPFITAIETDGMQYYLHKARINMRRVQLIVMSTVRL